MADSPYYDLHWSISWSLSLTLDINYSFSAIKISYYDSNSLTLAVIFSVLYNLYLSDSISRVFSTITNSNCWHSDTAISNFYFISFFSSYYSSNKFTFLLNSSFSFIFSEENSLTLLNSVTNSSIFSSSSWILSLFSNNILF